MDLEFVEFISKPFFSKGVKVTRENMADVAVWCEGKIESLEPQSTVTTTTTAVEYIKVPTFKPQNARQTMAFLGDWVMKSDSGFKVYKQKPLEKGFNRVHSDIDRNNANLGYFDPGLINLTPPLRADNALPPLSDVQIFNEVVEELKSKTPSLKHLSQDTPSPAMFDKRRVA